MRMASGRHRNTPKASMTASSIGLVDAVDDVPIFGIAKTIADLFRHRRIFGINVAVAGLREALRKRKATPAQIAKYASIARMWKTMEPYVSVLTRDG